MNPGVAITLVEIGGEVRLGNPSCSTPITAIGFLGIDAVTPTINYYYVQFTNEITMSSLFEAFCVNLDLPPVLGDSGFPHGFLSSFSLLRQELPHAGISIPAGYRLNGTLNILGLEGSADVTVSLPNGIDISVALPPINIGNGLLQMAASPSDSTRGPFLRAAVTLVPSPNIDVAASGFVKVLGISTSSTLRITNTHYEFNLSGRMFKLFQASLMISASYGSISQASFRVKGNFKSDLFSRITERIKEVLDSSANQANQAIGSAQAEVKKQHARFDDANHALQSAQNEVNKANSRFDAAEGAVRRARHKVNSVCST